MSNENAVATIEDGMTSMAIMQDGAMMDRIIRFAEVMASSKSTIPSELKNVGDCMAITMQAMNWKMNPYSVAQKVFFISGRIGYEAQLVAAAINNSGATKDTFNFEWYGPWEKVIGKFEIKRGDKGEYRVPGWKLSDEEGIGVKVWATLRNEDSPRVLDLLLAQARTRNSTLWADDPRQQLAYLAQKRWARLYAPGVILGVYTADEIQEIPERDMGNAEVVSTRPAEIILPEYTEEQMSANLAAWQKAANENKFNAERMIAMISTRYVLSPAQQAVIRSIKPQEQAQADMSEHADFVAELDKE